MEASLGFAPLLVSCLVACGAGAPASGQGGNTGEAGQDGKYLGFIEVAGVRDFFEVKWHIGAVAGGGALLLLVLLAALLTCCYCYKKRLCCFRRVGYRALERHPLRRDYHSPDAVYRNREPGQVEVRKGGPRYERTVGEELRRQKEEQEQSDRSTAKKIVLFHMRNDKRFQLTQDLPDMGSRMLKFWFKIRDQEGHERLLTIAPVSQKCPLLLDDKMVQTMNDLLRQLSHPNLHPALSISYEAKDHMVLITQPFLRSGSLKDAIYRSTPTSEWTMKYSRRSKGLSTSKVALYGRQILEGVLYIYKRKFPRALGHIQTGNIFVDGDTCCIGGYENTLLGYKTRSYKLCKEHLENVDLILFGHVVFEMRCGYELTELVAGEQHYADVKDQSIQEVLEFIFSRNLDGTFAHTIEQVYNLDFFQGARLPMPRGGGRIDLTELTADAKSLLAKVAKNKPRVQKTSNRKKRKPGKSSEVGHTSPSDADTAASMPKTATN